MWFTEKLTVQSNGIPKKSAISVQNSSFGKVYCFWLVDLGYIPYLVLTCSYACISIYIYVLSLFLLENILKYNFIL